MAADLTFGKLAGTSQGVRIYTSSDDYSGRAMIGPMVPADLRKCKTAAIELGPHTAIGGGAMIMPGCHVREGTVVGALSLLTHPTQPWSIYHGNPAKRIRSRDMAAGRLAEVMMARLSAQSLTALSA